MIGATVAMAAMAGLFVVFGVFALGDRSGCHTCDERGRGADCVGCPHERDPDARRNLNGGAR